MEQIIIVTEEKKFELVEQDKTIYDFKENEEIEYLSLTATQIVFQTHVDQNLRPSIDRVPQYQLPKYVILIFVFYALFGLLFTILALVFIDQISSLIRILPIIIEAIQIVIQALEGILYCRVDIFQDGNYYKFQIFFYIRIILQIICIIIVGVIDGINESFGMIFTNIIIQSFFKIYFKCQNQKVNGSNRSNRSNRYQEVKQL